MPNKFLSHDQQRAPKVRQLFTKLASRYDLANDLQSAGLHRFWKRCAVRLALKDLPANSRWLDLCCGTGDICFEAQRQGAGRVVGVDFTQAMLDVAVRRQSGPGISFVRADALQLPFADGQFDVVTIGYGLRNLADFEGGMREMLRVLRPGGRLVILDFGKPDNGLVRALYSGCLRLLLPVMGWLFHRDPETYVYIIDSLRTFPAQRGIESMMRQLGMANIRVFNPMLGTMGINYGERS